MLAFWGIGLVLLISYGYEGSFLMLNRMHHPLLDAIMPHLTHLADGIVLSSLFVLIVVRKEPALALSMLLGLLVVMFMVGLAKQQMFPTWDRPPLVFEGREHIHQLNMRPLRYRSFPSGHSAAAALMMLMYAFYDANKRTGWLWALATVVLAYTRLYIGVHFLGDILAGSFLGIVFGLAILYWFYPWMHARTQAMRPAYRKALVWTLGLLALAVLVSGILRLYFLYYQ